MSVNWTPDYSKMSNRLAMEEQRIINLVMKHQDLD